VIGPFWQWAAIHVIDLPAITAKAWWEKFLNFHFHPAVALSIIKVAVNVLHCFLELDGV